MLPWLIPALLSGMGLFGAHSAQQQRAEQWKKVMQMMAWAQNPQNVLGETKGMYEGMLRSPMFTSAQNDVMGAAQNAQNSLATRMVGSGVSGGVNAMSRAVGAGLPGIALSKLRSGLYENAFNTTQKNITDRIGAAAGIMTQPSPGENMMGSILGSMGPLLQMMLTKQPTVNPAQGSANFMGPMQGQDPRLGFMNQWWNPNAMSGAMRPDFSSLNWLGGGR